MEDVEKAGKERKRRKGWQGGVWSIGRKECLETTKTGRKERICQGRSLASMDEHAGKGGTVYGFLFERQGE